MKKSLSTLILISLIMLFVLPAMMPVMAGDEDEVNVGQAPTIITDASQITTVINNVVNWFFLIVMTVAAIFILVSAWTFLTAGGNPDSITKARQMLIYALVGVVVAVLAKGLPILIQSILESSR
jgi:heme O synthase-like polyprenyltransferase